MVMAIDVLLIVLLVVAIIVCVYLILSLKKITNTLTVLQEDLTEVKTKTVPILENLEKASEKALVVTTEAEAQFNDIKNTLQSFRDKVTGLVPTGKKTENPNPINDLVRNLGAISKGIAKFWSEYRR